MRKAGKIIRHLRFSIHYPPIRKADVMIFVQIPDRKTAPNKVVGFFNDYDKRITLGWQVFLVGAAYMVYRTTSDEVKEFQNKYYAHQRELLTAIAGLNKDAGKVDEEKEVLAPTAAAQEEGDKNETASAAATAQEEADKNAKATK